MTIAELKCILQQLAANASRPGSRQAVMQWSEIVMS